MAKAKRLNKEFYKRRLYAKKFLNCQVHKSFLKDIHISILERQVIYQKISKYSINSSLSRFNNICMLTGRSRSVYRDVLLSRHKLNEMVLSGLIQGCINLHGKNFFKCVLL